MESVQNAIATAVPRLRLPNSLLSQPVFTWPSSLNTAQIVSLPTLLALLLTYLVLTRLQTRHRLSAFPGPKLATISYWPMFALRRSGAAHLRYAALSQRHGPLTRIGPNDLLCADPDLLRRMSAARSPYERSSWYQATRLDPYHDMMGSVLSKSAHQDLRAKLSAGYAGKDNAALEADMDADVAALVRRVETMLSGTGDDDAGATGVDVGTLADWYAHDAKARLALGRPLGMLAQGRDVHGLVATTRRALRWVQVFTDVPPLRRLFLSATVLKLLGPKPTDAAGVGKLMGLAREVVAARFRPDAVQKQDLLGSFLHHGLDRRSAESEVMFPIIAGADTTATAIKTTILHIATHPDVAAALQAELRSTGTNLASPATHAQTRALPFLQAVVWEGLRMHPPFGGLIMKAVGPGGDVYGGGTALPAGTRIGHSTWAVVRDRAVYGDDVHVFRPQRWCEADGVRRAAMMRQTELVFGCGRWGCPGRAVALMEIEKVVVELFRRFDIRPLGGHRPLSPAERAQCMDGSLPMVITQSDGALESECGD